MLSNRDEQPTILILRFSSIGDIVLTTAAFEFIKQRIPDVRLVLVTKKTFTPLFEQHPFVDDVIGFDGFTKGFWQFLSNARPAAILDLHNNLRSLRIKLGLWNLPSFSVKKRSLNRWLLIKKWRNKAVDSVAIRYVEAAEELVKLLYGTSQKYRLNANLDILESPSVAEFPALWNTSKGLEQHKLPGLTLADFPFPLSLINNELKNELGGIMIESILGKYGILHISATYNTKRIPFKVWEYLLLNQQEPLIITGGKEDVDNAMALMEIAKKRVDKNSPVINVVGKSNLQETAALIQGARWYIGGDTGFTHVAAAYGTPHVVFWGNTSPDLGFVPWLGSKYVYEIQEHMQVKGLACNPCSKLGYGSCPQGHFSCMKLQNLQDLESKLQFFRDRNY